MEYPRGTGKKTPKIQVNRFYGLNHNAVSGDGYFSDCKNIVSEYPVIHTASGYTAEDIGEFDNVTALVKANGVSGFCGVAGEKVYWNGTELTLSADMQFKPQANSEKHAYMFNKFLYIWEKRTSGKTVLYRYDTINRDNWDYNYVRQVGILDPKTMSTQESGQIIKKIPEPMTFEKETGYGYYRFNEGGFGDFDANKKYVIAGAEGNEESFMKIRDFDYEVMLTEAIYAKWNSNPGEVGEHFAVYTKNNNRIYNPPDVETGIKAYLYEYGHYPMQATRPVIWKGRVWQARLGGESIIATAFDSGEDFYSFDNLASDSVEISVKAEGEFKGVFAYNESLLAFKKNSITVIYGDTASDFAIGKTIEGVGTCDIRSVVSIGGRLYFCDGESFYVYSGGFPKIISQNLDFKFSACVAFEKEGRYVAEGTLSNGKKLLYTYDTEKGIWLREAPIGIREVIRYEKDIYLLTGNGVKKPKGVKEWESEDPEWYLESTDLYEGIFEKKGISEIYIRAKIGAGQRIDVYVISDGEKTLAKTVYGEGVIKTYRIPVPYKKQEMYRYRLEGSGHAVIYDIERSVAYGGRNIGE